MYSGEIIQEWPTLKTDVFHAGEPRVIQHGNYLKQKKDFGKKKTCYN